MELSSDLIWKFIKFGIVGFSGVFIDFGITWLMRDKLRLNQYISNSTGFMCAVVSNYILNRIWTFESQDPAVAVQFSKFLLISLVGLAINNSIIYLLNERFKIKFYVAKLIATGIVTIWNFGANLLFTFVD
ncbi:MAG: GtrA family protein [Saprospiraceae bacterium]|jgi:putative flippase GtrA